MYGPRLTRTALTLTMWIGSRISGLRLQRKHRHVTQKEESLHYQIPLVAIIMCSVSNKPKVTFMHGSNQIEQKKKIIVLTLAHKHNCASF